MFWDAQDHAYLNTCLIVDPASGKKETKGNDDHDYTALWLLGLGADYKWRTIFLMRDKLGLEDRWKLCDRLYFEYNCLYLFYEEVGSQTDIEHFGIIGRQVKREMNIVTLHPAAMGKVHDKASRIRSLPPRFERKEIYLPTSCIHVNHEGVATDMVQEFLKMEYTPYPKVKHDDMLDALAYINHPIVRSSMPVPKDPYLASIAASQDRKARQNMDVC